MRSKVMLLFSAGAIAGPALILLIFHFLCIANAKPKPELNWSDIPSFSLSGGLHAFWDMYDYSNGENLREATARGFTPITQYNIYVDYPGSQKENIYNYIGKRPINPWNKPPFFENTIRRNIEMRGSTGIHVHDIEFDFERDVDKAWQDKAVQAASGVDDRKRFDDSYFREWSTWYTLPLVWTRQKYPDARVGLYGVQPFKRDYWGIAGKNQSQIDAAHIKDIQIWKHIEPFVDFYISDIYTYDDRPESVYYMAVNVEENFLRTRSYGNKPVYAYEWLRYQNFSCVMCNRELAPYLVEAMAVIPFFEGARGIVLWGYELQIKQGDGPPNKRLPLFMKTLQRVGKLSNKIGSGRLRIDEPAHVLWKEKRPLVRSVVVSVEECIAMAINPWQGEDDESKAEVRCGSETYSLSMRGRHTTIALINEHGLIEY